MLKKDPGHVKKDPGHVKKDPGHVKLTFDITISKSGSIWLQTAIPGTAEVLGNMTSCMEL